MERVIVIGAGVGGLAAAVRLQNAGYQVALYEKEPQVGGKMSRIREEGFTFDVGPTIVMMPELYREVFEVCGRDPEDYVPMRKVEPLMEIAFGPDERMRLSNDLSDLTAGLEAVSEEDAQGYFEYLALLYKRFRIAKDQLPRAVVPFPLRLLQPEKPGGGRAVAHVGRRVLVGGPLRARRPPAQGAGVPDALHRHLALRGALAVHDHPHDRAGVRRVVHARRSGCSRSWAGSCTRRSRWSGSSSRRGGRAGSWWAAAWCRPTPWCATPTSPTP